MLNFFKSKSGCLSLFASLFIFTALAALPARAQVQYVDPTIGNISILLVPTRPTVYIPNSMVRVYPMRDDALSDQIDSFPLTISSHRQPEVFSIMPGDGSPAAYDQEVTTPYYYATRLDNSLTRIEFTPTTRSGYFRFTYTKSSPALVLANREKGSLHFANNAVTGEEHVGPLTIYIYGQFSAPVEATATKIENGDRLAFTSSATTLGFRYGVSFISIDQAEKTLHEQIPAWDFEKIKDAAKARWNEVLGQIQVEGGTDAQKRVFYTALYRSYERMIDITEDGRYFSSFDNKVHTDPRPFYVDNWLWDTFRALEPLQTLLNPQMEADKIQSYVRMYQQSGIMPTFALAQGNYACMNGNHAAPWFADAWYKGIHNFDLKTAYEGVRKRSLEDTHLPWRLGPKGPLDDFYNEHGYMPALRPGEKETDPMVHPFEKRQPVPVTLENSLDDWDIAQLARALNKPEDEKLFLKRAQDFKNLYRADKSLFWPKDAEGKWIEPMDPKFSGGLGGRNYYDENNGYTYQWDVAEDFGGLVHLMGGPAKAEANLDQLFREPLGRSRYEFQAKFPDSTSMMGQFSMGNEPSLAIPYIYNRVGAPWKTQKRIRSLIHDFFPATLHGIPGDEDGGGMSAFVVFSMLGFYPVTPGIPTYDIGSPIFSKAVIHLKNGKDFVILAHNTSADNKYIQSIKLNGKPLNQVWFRHSAIANGGTLDIEMGNTPNFKLGADPSTFPPDSLTVNPKDYVN